MPQPLPIATPHALREVIRERAYALGFDVVRFTDAEPFPQARSAIRERVAAGYFEGMDWFTAERAEVSCAPRALWPEARSLIALGTFYLTEPNPPADTQPRGVVSRYAWGDDYHTIIRSRLDALATFVREQAPPGQGHAIPFVDTGRIVDRAVAQRAGLGWYGKNTCILTKGWGSWVFLAELATSLDLAADPPLGASCGHCEVCLHACPTGAFVAPYVLDNTRCIAYLTIEHRGAIPMELRPLMGTHIFGCDICQTVCPVNHVAERRLRARGALGVAGERPAFAPRADLAAPALIPLLSLDADGFRERFRGSPVKRAKRPGLLRNVCVALGNLGNPAAIPALLGALGDTEPLIRGHAAWALGRIGGGHARDGLAAALTTEAEPQVRQEIAYALAMSPGG